MIRNLHSSVLLIGFGLLLGPLPAAAQAKPKSRVKTEAPNFAKDPDIRSFCNDSGTVTIDQSKPGTTARLLEMKSGKQRFVKLTSGTTLVARPNENTDELVLDENGRYRRLLKTIGTIKWISESPDGKHVAVFIARDESAMKVGHPSSGGLYLFETETWKGEEFIRSFAFTALAWSPDSGRLALGDVSRLHIVDMKTRKETEFCAVDSAVTADENEWIRKLSWRDDSTVEFEYVNPRGMAHYVVKLK